MATHKPYVVLATNPSSSSSAIHEVRRGGDGVLYCSCRGWIASKDRPRMCTHTKKYVMANPSTEYILGKPNREQPGAYASTFPSPAPTPERRAATADWRSKLLAEKTAAVARGVKQNPVALAAYARDLDLD